MQGKEGFKGLQGGARVRLVMLKIVIYHMSYDEPLKRFDSDWA